MENYEKKYKKALERAATELETCGADESLRNMIYAIFPDELKESEDEQTRKGLINFLKSPFIKRNICDWKVAPWIAWLEKQELSQPVTKISDKVWSEEDEKAFEDLIGYLNFEGQLDLSKFIVSLKQRLGGK